MSDVDEIRRTLALYSRFNDEKDSTAWSHRQESIVDFWHRPRTTALMELADVRVAAVLAVWRDEPPVFGAHARPPETIWNSLWYRI